MPSLKDFYLKNFQLPNGGGTFQSPAPIVQGTENPMPQATWGNGAPVYQNPLQSTPITATPPAKPLFTPAPVAPAPTAPQVNPKDINPATGKYFTAKEYADNVALSLPRSSIKPSGDIGAYAGAALETQATRLNNARNDIATGTTDPYDVTEGGTIVYSPTERAAIDKAYAGIYDPALNDVFARLKEKQAEDDARVEKESKLEILAKQFEYDKQLKSMGGTSDGLTANQIQSSLDRINDDFRMDPSTQQYTQAAAGWDTISKIDAKKATSADDISAIYAFAKIMDPGSVVREGEYATVQKYAQSWAESFGFKAQRIFSNQKFLSTQALENMRAAAKSKVASLESAYNSSRKTFEQRQQDILSGKVASGLPNYGYQTAIDNNSQNLPPSMVLNGQTLYLQADGTYE